MTTIASLLGISWNSSDWLCIRDLRGHARKQALLKGFDPVDVLRAANDPAHTYPNGRYPNQRRHVRDGIVAVVDVTNQQIVTVYADQQETPLRPDQTQRDALNYERDRRNRN